MAILYRVYSNRGTGGAVDYTSPVATTAALSATVGPLSPAGDYRFTVRAFDDVSGIEEANTQASVRVVLDATGRDGGPPPAAPSAVHARPTAGGGCVVSWSYPSPDRSLIPTRFLVYLTPGSTPNLSSPAASVLYLPRATAYSCALTGLVDGVGHAIAVVATTDSIATSVPATTMARGDSTPPADVEGLTASAIA